MTAAPTAQEHGTAEPAGPGALSELIRHANEGGITYQRMADRGVLPDGSRLPMQWYQKLVKTPPVKPPSADQLEAIKEAIDMPLRRVQEAAALQWLRYEATELSGYDEEVRIIVGHLAGKSKAELLRWRMMIEADEKARRQSED